ncbi:MAG TPA: ABC transporter permease [Spirochaetaceae bacterium]|nr:ABC transporter permease [Spirochaetaceae bacterium]
MAGLIRASGTVKEDRMSGFMKMLRSRKIAIAGICFLLLLVFMALFASFIAPIDPMDIDPANRLLPPGKGHVFGTDNFGRDIWSCVVFGSRTSIISSLGVVLFSVTLGIVIGLAAGYFKALNAPFMRIIDVMMAFPSLLLALVLMTIFGRGLINVILAVGITYLTRTTRIVYGMTLKLKEEVYIEAFRAAGASNIRLLLRHIFPNLASPVIVQATFTFAFSLLDMASLDFLGLGLPPEIPSWGNMLSEGSIYLVRAPWMLLIPGIFIVLTVLSFNLVGDVLRDQVDPRFRHDIKGV